VTESLQSKLRQFGQNAARRGGLRQSSLKLRDRVEIQNRQKKKLRPVGGTRTLEHSTNPKRTWLLSGNQKPSH